MAVTQTQNKLWSAVAFWILTTLLYFLLNLLLIALLAPNLTIRILLVFGLTILYAISTLVLGRRIWLQAQASNRELQLNITERQSSEQKLQQELAERARTAQALRHRNAELAALNETTLDLLNRFGAKDLLETIVARAATLMNTAHGFLYVTNPAQPTLTLRVGIGRFAEYLGLALAPGQALAGTVWQTGKPLVLADYATWVEHMAGFEWVHAIVCIPLCTNSNIVGVIGLAHLDPERNFDAEALALLERFGHLASLALENAALYAQTQQELQERKLAEQKMQETFAEVERAQTKARAILDAATDIMLLVSPEHKILAVNQSFCDQFFGHNPRDTVGHQFSDYATEIEQTFADPVGLRKLVSDTVDDQAKFFQQIIAQRTPKPRELQLSSSPVHTRTNEYLGRLFVFHDVTREREVDRMKTEFVSMVSHELRTPLTSIKGYIDLLQAGEVGEVSEEQREFLDIIKTNADRLVELINDLLDLSRIEAGRIELKRKAVDLGRLIHQVTHSLKPLMTAKQQHLTLNLDPAMPPVWGDADRVTQILTNFVSNAYKYTPAGGTLTIATRTLFNKVLVDVQDTGIGLSADEQKQLFTKFFRAKNRATQEVSGTGLGLAITRSLVEMHGGEITVTSAPGQGSTFSFTLPIAQQAPAAEAAVLPPQPAQPGKRVLVVDDEPDIANLIRRYLERAGYQVILAHNGHDALQIAQTEQPDLVTLDIVLADTDGFTVLEWLKNNSRTKSIPVVLLSIMADEKEGQLMGAVDYLTKPVNEQVLLQHVARALAKDRPRTILVVDDDADNRQLVTEFLTRAGYQVLTARDGAEALQIAQEKQPGLALMDIRMPGIDGITALHELRTRIETRAMPIVMMTGFPAMLEDNRAEMGQLNAPITLSKPFTADQLAAAIGAALKRGETP